MYAWIIFFAFLEVYSIGMTLLAKRSGMAHYGLCLIPFVSFFYIDKILPEGFTVLGIRVKSLGKLSVKMLIIVLIAYFYALWGIKHLNPINIKPLKQIALVPVMLSVTVLWGSLVSSTLILLFGFDCNFRCDVFVCMLFVTIPFILAFMNLKNKNYITDFRRKL